MVRHVGNEPGPPPTEEAKPAEAELVKEDSFSNFLKESLATASTDNRPKGARQVKRIADKDMGQTHEAADENLGENFEETPWLPPSIEKAIEFRKKSIYHGGNVRIESLDVVSAPDLGAGTTLYFQFAFTMCACLFVMSVLSLPSLVFIYSGTGVKPEDQDAFGLYKYTLGNIGVNDYALPEARCTSGAYQYNDTCIHYGDSEISVSDAANVMTAMEFIQIFVFMFGIVYLQHKSFSVTGRTSKTQTAISDYSVEVHNIPPDTKDWQILQHFSDLYALDKVDWKGRPAVEGAHAVQNCENSNNPMHLSTWVAECTLHKGIGSFIASFKDKQYLMEKLYRCRAKMKMYAENSPHAGGHKLSRYLAAEQEMIATGTLIDRLTEHTIKKKKLKILVNSDEETGARPSTSGGRPQSAGPNSAANTQRLMSTQQISNPNSIYRNIDAPAVSCYITFQYAESAARCVEDYEKYSMLPYSLFYPQQLMFRGLKLRVNRAPEPDQIVWENLEIPFVAKMLMRARTAIIAVALVILCFVIILQASIYKNIFSGRLPVLSLCEKTVPQLYTNGSTEFTYKDIELTRPPDYLRMSLDAKCERVMGGSAFYAVYSRSGNFTDKSSWAAHYDYDACDAHGYCPVYGASSYCPCVSTQSSQLCTPANCAAGDERKECEQFKASNIGVCFCYTSLNDGLSADGVVTTMQKLDSSDGDTSCKSFYREYTLSVGLTYASVATTTIANTFLRTYLKVLTKHEAHTSSDEMQGSIMAKIFQTSYLMMTVIVLIAYGTASGGVPQFFEDVKVFVGPYDDFTRPWYGNIGFYLMTTFIIQSFSPLVFNLFMHFVGKPLQRYYHHEQVRKLKSTSIVMQYDLNMLEVGPVFDSTMHTAQLLTLLFFAMTFAPGLPLLMPLCCFAFLLYFRIDKYLLCRFYQKPPQLGDAAIRMVIAQLPYAAVLRLAFACWMLGNGNILPESTQGGLSDSTSASATAAANTGGFADRLTRSNTLPLLVLMILIIAGKIILKFFEYVPILFLLRCFVIIASEAQDAHQGNINKRAAADGHSVTVHPWDLVKLGDPARQQVAPFTGEYLRFVKHKDEIPDTCMQMCSYAYLTNLEQAEIEDGWEMRHQGDFVVKVKVWKEVKKRSKHRRGDLKKTYEVIADHRCATYNIEKIPAYVIPMQGLREGTLSMMEYEIRNKQDKNVVDSLMYDAFDSGTLESNVVANYQKRKTGHGADIGPSAAKIAARRAAAAQRDEEEGEEDEGGEAVDQDDRSPVGDKPVKPKPTIQTKGSRGVAVDAGQDSMYMTDVSTPTPKGMPPTPHSFGAGGGRGQANSNSTSIGNISMTTGSKKSASTPTASALPAYLQDGPDEPPSMGDREVHKPYFPKSRSAASADSGEDTGGHKPYFPPSRSDSNDGGKKKKDKKKKKKEHAIELAPVAAPSPYAQPSSGARGGTQSAYTYDAYAGEDPYDDGTGYEYQEGGDWDDAGGIGGLI